MEGYAVFEEPGNVVIAAPGGFIGGMDGDTHVGTHDEHRHIETQAQACS